MCQREGKFLFYLYILLCGEGPSFNNFDLCPYFYKSVPNSGIIDVNLSFNNIIPFCC